MNILRDYIAYAKSLVNPKISEAAGQAFIQEYVNMRKIGSGRGQVSAYPRQLESLIRLAEAHSRMRLSDTVDVADVEEAMRYIVKPALSSHSKEDQKLVFKTDLTFLLNARGAFCNTFNLHLATICH